MIFDSIRKLMARPVVECNFHGTKAFTENRSVSIKNLNYIQKAEMAMIIFFLENDRIVKWQFENIEARDTEFSRILELITTMPPALFF